MKRKELSELPRNYSVLAMLTYYTLEVLPNNLKLGDEVCNKIKKYMYVL